MEWFNLATMKSLNLFSTNSWSNCVHSTQALQQNKHIITSLPDQGS